MTGFFTKHAAFGETSVVASDLARLNFRYDHVIERNKDILAGKRVLDIASHDGRFSFAAVQGAGAKSVLGIEAREHLVKGAEANFATYGVDPASYRFVVGDIFEEIGKIEPGTIDTAMVLGFLYHTARQYEIFSWLSRLGVKNIIVDSNVIRTEKPFVLMKVENTAHDSQIWDPTRPKVLSSTPSALALELMMQDFGYATRLLEPQGDVPRTALQYSQKNRVTIVGTRP